MSRKICRLCLNMCDVSFKMYEPIELEDSWKICDILRFLAPEVYLGVSLNPEICLSCKTDLQKANQFRQKCLHTESIISSFLKKTNCTAETIDLFNVIDYREYPSNYEMLQIHSQPTQMFHIESVYSLHEEETPKETNTNVEVDISKMEVKKTNTKNNPLEIALSDDVTDYVDEPEFIKIDDVDVKTKTDLPSIQSNEKNFDVEKKDMKVIEKPFILSTNKQQLGFCIFTTKCTNNGDYINDHDYLINPYRQNNIFKFEKRRLRLKCFICNSKHLMINHIEHMKRHYTQCYLCGDKQNSPFSLNLHCALHFTRCRVCKKFCRYRDEEEHQMLHHKKSQDNNEKSVYFPILLYPGRNQKKYRNKNQIKEKGMEASKSTGKTDEQIINVDEN